MKTGPDRAGYRGPGRRTWRIARTDLGLALLQRHCLPGVPLTLEDIAAWGGCSRQAIECIQRVALHKIRNALMFRDPDLWEELRLHFTAERETAKPVSNHRGSEHAG